MKRLTIVCIAILSFCCFCCFGFSQIQWSGLEWGTDLPAVYERLSDGQTEVAVNAENPNEVFAAAQLWSAILSFDEGGLQRVIVTWKIPPANDWGAIYAGLVGKLADDYGVPAEPPDPQAIKRHTSAPRHRDPVWFQQNDLTRALKVVWRDALGHQLTMAPMYSSDKKCFQIVTVYFR